MIQNGANVSPVSWTASLLTLVALGAAPADPPPLLRLHDEARALLERAGRADVPSDDALRTLADAGRHLATLGAEPAPGTASKGRTLTPETRRELRRAAEELAGIVRSGAQGPHDTGPYLALLERVRAQLQGEIALGLSLEGSYSQGQARDPAYGGHASAMGPPPAQVPAARDAPEGAASPVTFEEAPRLGTKTYAGGATKDHILESAGNGVALFDYDGDGRLDIYLVTAAELTAARERVPHRNALYRNLGSWRFEDVSARAGVDAAAWGSGACAGDFDGDRRLDLYVTNWGPNLLYRNHGDGTFAEVAAKAGVQAGGWSTGCSFFDADADGDLDLYVARYVAATWDDLARARRTLTWRNGPRIMVGPAGLPGESDLYYENLGGGRFAEGAEAHGLGDAARGYGFGVVTTDYDDDGFVDVFVANDSTPNFLYRNRGDGRFESVGLLAGVAVNAEARAQAGMGADAGDADGDGRMDLVLTAFARDTNTLYRNLDGRQFTDASGPSGLAARTYERMGWGAAFLDADLDGRLDLFFANGHIFADVDEYPQLQETFRQKNQLLLGTGAGFRDVSESAGKGLQIARVGRGLAVGDLDDDGDLDLVVSNMDEEPTLLENRQATGHHWVAFRLSWAGPNAFAIGAKVTVTAGDRRQVREVRSGGSYLSQSDLRAHFGLGGHAGPVDVDVRLPGGRRFSWRGLAADRLHVLELPR
jgi:hypothetical protein